LTQNLVPQTLREIQQHPDDGVREPQFNKKEPIAEREKGEFSHAPHHQAISFKRHQIFKVMLLWRHSHIHLKASLPD